MPKTNEPIGFDSYNLCLTRQVGRTLSTPGGGLNEHIPCVIEPICFTHDTWMKINNEGVAYTVLERDNKNPQCVVIEDEDMVRG
jgi:hypothetical protein